MAPARKNGGDSSSKSGSNKDLEKNMPIIIGVSAAVAVLLLVIIIFCICRRVHQKKKKKRLLQNPYQAQGGGDPRYYNQNNPPQLGNGFQGDHTVGGAPPGSGGGWGPKPPVPPPPNGGGGGWGPPSAMQPPNGSGGNGGGVWGSSSPMPPPSNASGGGSGWGSSSPMLPPPNGSGGGNGWGSSSPMLPNTGGGPIYSGEESQNFSGVYQAPLPPPPPGIPIGCKKSNFTYDELSTATNGFSRANQIGQGGFGYVHKGVLPNGKEVAIKSLKTGGGQGEREFQAEVDIISRVHHRHLVSLVGYCVTGDQRMLVYDFVPNNTLEYHLHGNGVPVMDFPSRLRIALGAAKGLAYLHEDCHPKIIHRDIKSANILLDNNFEAMVADFGLARLSADNHTHVSTRVMGTFGYLAPEYASSGKLTDKSDVFSYGIMVLELITGKEPVDSSLDDTLVDWVRPLLTTALQDGNLDEIIDPRLEGNYNLHEMLRMITCASACIRQAARKRPKMSQIVRALQGDASLEDLNEVKKATDRSTHSSEASSEYSSASYSADMKKFKQPASTSSQEFSSGEYGASSTENSREMVHGEIQKQRPS